MNVSEVIYILILCSIWRQNTSRWMYCPKSILLYCFGRKKLKKSKNTVLGYKKGSKINFDNWNEIFRGDLYNDFVLHFASNHVWKRVLPKRDFLYCFGRKKLKKSKDTVLSYKKGSKISSDDEKIITTPKLYRMIYNRFLIAQLEHTCKAGWNSFAFPEPRSTKCL